MQKSLGDRVMDRITDAVPFILVTIFVLFAVGICVVVYDAVFAETFSLRKDQWHCSGGHAESSTTYVQSGKVLVPITNTSTVCDRWERIN